MNAMKMLLAGAALAVSAAGANAATYYANQVIDHTPIASHVCGSEGCNPDRQNPLNALGAPDDEFYSLSLGGFITLGFGRSYFGVDSDVSVYEITYGRGGSYREAVDVYAVLGSSEVHLGRLINDVVSSSIRATVPFQYIKLVDATIDEFGPGSRGARGDGFDVDSVMVAAIPLPAAGMLLLGGLGGLAALRRRKKAN